MTEFKAEQTVVIQAPISAVYEYVSDFPRHIEWNHQPTEMTKMTDGPVGVGSVFRTTEQMPSNMSWLMKTIFPLMSKLMGAADHTEATITALEPEHRVAWTAQAPLKKGGFAIKTAWEILLDSPGEGTKVTQKVHFRFFNKLSERMNVETMAAQIGDEMGHNLARLKELVEAQTATENATGRPAFA